jgi:hypothetical protein
MLMAVLEYSSGKDHHRPRSSKRFVVISLVAAYGGVVLSNIWESVAIDYFRTSNGGGALYGTAKFQHYDNWCMQIPGWFGLLWVLTNLVISTVALARRRASGWLILLNVLGVLAAIPTMIIMGELTAMSNGLYP